MHERAVGGGPCFRHLRSQREGHDQRSAGLHRSRRGHRRAGGLPARACMSEAALPRAHGEAVLSATIRTSPEDFFVEEIDAFAASGAGEHLLLAIEKDRKSTRLNYSH